MKTAIEHAGVIGNHIRDAERDVDVAIASVARAIASMAQARAEVSAVDVSISALGQAELVRLGGVQTNLIAGRSDVARVHSGLRSIGVTAAGPDLDEDCGEARKVFFGQLRAVG